MKKYTLITGASAGIGWELARVAAAQGNHLVLVARRRERLQQLAEELKSQYNVEVIVLASDLTDQNAATAIFDFCQREKLQVQHLVNNAGLGDLGFFSEAEVGKQCEMIQVNITALTLLTRLFLPSMLAAGYGRILNIASVAAFQPGPLMAVYYATKSYVLHFSEAIANELEKSGVTVTVACPGPTESEFKFVAHMEESGLMKNRKNPSSREVAAFSYAAMMKGKRVAIHGLQYRIMVFMARFSPRSWTARIARFMNAPR